MENNEQPQEKKHINIKILDNEGTTIECKVKRHTTFSKILDEYAKATNKSPKELKVALRGKFLSLEQTPNCVAMEDGDSLEIMSTQIGG
ncbi:Ubiquitin-like protein [Spraguea lophii 42_110]|uniref:Ubiquitin-like protein n=1 Tax=Spraguea lophii (strain 42_110) TaxID=1358809 RepID=S7XGE0_SPRLO|nr:Ubiquitin-like protein [Spraguea lophii 42_110]